jgi:hypothetical protein
MDEKKNNVNSNTRSSQNGAEQNAVGLNEPAASQQAAKMVEPPPAPPSPERADTEHRQVYGTAKTENLRDSGNWRWILPAFVALCCLAILAAPLIIVVPLFVNSLAADSPDHGVIWLWVTMFVIEVAVAVFIGRSLIKIFWTQAGNY